jgi:hypothetical protein
VAVATAVDSVAARVAAARAAAWEGARAAVATVVESVAARAAASTVGA